MTPFEQGYKAFLDGVPKDANPFDEEVSPKSRVKWDAGWNRALGNRRARS